jgi:hypothetical protein
VAHWQVVLCDGRSGVVQSAGNGFLHIRLTNGEMVRCDTQCAAPHACH